MNGLTEEQVAVLLRPIKPGRVKVRDGQAYVEAHDDRAAFRAVFPEAALDDNGFRTGGRNGNGRPV